MKILYIGGIKSGKSRLAEQKALELARSKPYYLATSEIVDEEMNEKIQRHQQDREDRFITIEEPLEIKEAVLYCKDIVLVECLSMWINNMLHYKRDDILESIETLLKEDKDFIFVINDVSSGVISENALTREFVNLNGVISQIAAMSCNEVYHCIAGIEKRIK